MGTQDNSQRCRKLQLLWPICLFSHSVIMFDGPAVKLRVMSRARRVLLEIFRAKYRTFAPVTDNYQKKTTKRFSFLVQSVFGCILVTVLITVCTVWCISTNRVKLLYMIKSFPPSNFSASFFIIQHSLIIELLT